MALDAWDTSVNYLCGPNGSDLLWHLNGNGTVCKDSSHIGARMGDGGDANLAHSVLQQELRLVSPTVVFNECTEDREPKQIASVLPNHSTYTVMLHPTAVGEPYSRPRRMTTSISNQEVGIDCCQFGCC